MAIAECTQTYLTREAIIIIELGMLMIIAKEKFAPFLHQKEGTVDLLINALTSPAAALQTVQGCQRGYTLRMEGNVWPAVYHNEHFLAHFGSHRNSAYERFPR